MKEYKVMKDGKLWSDRFNSIEDAEEHINKEQIQYPRSTFEAYLMTQEEIDEYYK